MPFLRNWSRNDSLVSLRAQLDQRRLLDLADAVFGEAEALADFFIRRGCNAARAVCCNSIMRKQHIPLAVVQVREKLPDVIACDHGIAGCVRMQIRKLREHLVLRDCAAPAYSTA